MNFSYWIILIAVAVILVMSLIMYMASRYKRCPSDMILVVYGKVGAGQSSRCIHGGGAFILPLIQECKFMSLTPLTIAIPLKNALSLQNIRIDVPSTFTVGISTDKSIMNNAAERLLNLRRNEVEDMAREIIFGQLRLTVASLTIEQINQDRESFLESIRKNVEPELNKIGLYLINVNITDIESIGKKAASEAVNRAKVDVAEQTKMGAIGESEAQRDQSIRVAENLASAEKGKKTANADQRIIVQQQETLATIGEAEAEREKTIRVAENIAESEKGKKRAEAERRVFIQQREAEAIQGENESAANIAESNATLAIKKADALRQAEVAKRQAEVQIQKAQAMAEQERLTADEVVRQEIDKRKMEIAAEAQAEKYRREAKGEADAILLKYEAEAKGIRLMLDSKAEGYASLVTSCGGDARAAGTLLMIEKIEEIVARQVEAVKNLKIDKITVWDSGNGKDGGSSTSNFVSSLIKTLPPLQDIAGMAGVELPGFLGRTTENCPKTGQEKHESKGA